MLLLWDMHEGESEAELILVPFDFECVLPACCLPTLY